MNKSRILKLADKIESLSPDEFCMEHWVHPCGTPSCVAGWAVYMFRPEKFKEMSKASLKTEHCLPVGWPEEARDILGLENARIFYLPYEAKTMARHLRELVQ